VRSILLAIGLALPAGCGPLFGAGDPLAGAPAAVRERSALPSCGSESVAAGGRANLDGRRCFWSAYEEGRPAEFVSTQRTIEGDPITSIYRVLPGGAAEVFIDSTKDAWSARTWLHLACPGLALIDGAADQPAFGAAEGCLETTIR
jgi:hypothetical protein